MSGAAKDPRLHRDLAFFGGTKIVKPFWVDVSERYPEENRKVQLLLVGPADNDTGARNIEYATGTWSAGEWVFDPPMPTFTQVVAWLESDRLLTYDDVSSIPKNEIRY